MLVHIEIVLPPPTPPNRGVNDCHKNVCTYCVWSLKPGQDISVQAFYYIHISNILWSVWSIWLAQTVAQNTYCVTPSADCDMARYLTKYVKAFNIIMICMKHALLFKDTVNCT